MDSLDRVGRLRALLDATPDTTRWRMRAAVGERRVWCELPEEIR